MSFIYPKVSSITGRITQVYQYMTEIGPIYGYLFEHNTQPVIHELMLYTRNEGVGKNFPYPQSPIPVNVEISTEGNGFEVLKIEILQ